MTFHDMTNLRLEVEIPSAGLPNLVKNPSGDKGAWFWLTPVTNTTISRGPNNSGLSFTTTVSQACNFTTDFMPVAATKWVAARFDLLYTGGTNVKVTFDWYNSAKVLLSSSAQSAALNTLGTNYVGEQQAPANTAYVKARFNYYAGGGGNPSANAKITFTKAMVTWSSTSGIASTRTNLVRNPSFETNTTGWGSHWGGMTLTRVTTTPDVGTYCLEYKRTSAAGDMSPETTGGTGGMPVTGGKNYAMRLRVRTASVGRPVYPSVRYFNAVGSELVVIGGSGVTDSTSWQTITMNTTAPSGAAYASMGLYCPDTVPTGELHYLDAALLENANSPGAYFDGASSGAGMTYAWTGTAHASTSTETAASFAFTEPNDWRNILGPTFEMFINRQALDAGTLTAKVSDPLLDPAETSDVRPGKLVRLQAFVNSAWTSVYEGKLTKALVTYDDQTVITLTAVDNVAALANRGETRGLATISSLPFILEDKGVPWNVNGSGAQVTSATQVSSNENASVLDQVAITRDSALGYAWVDRNNVLQIWDAAKLGPNLVTNSTFEADATGWSSQFNNTLTRVTSQFHSGVASGQMSSTASGDMKITPDSQFPGLLVGPNARVTLEVWTRAATTARSVRFEIDEWDAANNGTHLNSPSTTNAVGSWTKHTYTFTTLSTTVALRVQIAVLATGAAAEVHYVDDVVMSFVQCVYTDVPSADAAFDSYKDIDADFDTDRCINEVLVKWLRYNATTGQTEEIPYGPYRDQTSIDTWGPFAAEFTIHGASENATTIQNYANSILAANATPARRANSITTTVTDARSFGHAALIDLYSLVHVDYSTKVNEDYRVTGIQHTITAAKWLTTYDFDVMGSVAAPQVTPSPPTVPGGVIEGQWIPVTYSTSWSAYPAWTTPAFMRKNGVVYLKGLVRSTSAFPAGSQTGSANNTVFVLPAGYRPGESMHVNRPDHTGGVSRWNILSDGTVKLNWGAVATTANSWFGFDGISFIAEA